MTDEEALKEIDWREKRFAAAKCGRGLQLAKSAREYYQTIVKCRQKLAGRGGDRPFSVPVNTWFDEVGLYSVVRRINLR